MYIFLVNIIVKLSFFKRMKKFFSFLVAALAIAIAATMTSCSNKPAAPEIPEGEAIGNVRYFIDEATGLVSFIKETVENGKEVVPTQYTKVTQEDGFLVGTESKDKLNILTLDGTSFAIASTYEVRPIFPVSANEPTDKKIILTTVPGNDNHLAYDIKAHVNLSPAGGIKSVAIPLSNGITIYQNAKGWGFAPNGADDGTLESLKAINMVAAKGMVYFWVSSPDYTGIIDKDGNGIKPMSTAAFKALQKKGKLLWEYAGAVGIEVKAI